MATPKMDMEQLKRAPGAAFENPLEVVSHEGLSTEQKNEVLVAWERLAEAEQDRADGQTERLLEQIAEARARLRAGSH